ncbi:hypothetical protein [Fibrella forsythiae]|uniref:Monoheme cytochrome C n=1 Tax=Fibrella forsythiae TaxID=2817061 RepID=A0ABS3JIX4_9BACT|nr:hypothetical protein [Fibrella forsythiae]MBO0949363.1 hypothetical protein [Fibrella forsythiae]
MKPYLLFTSLCLLLTGLASFRDVPAPERTQPIMLADTVKIDPESGLIADPNLMMVKTQCTACHSTKLILQHRFTRAGWTERIRWMQKYHKLWNLGEAEKPVLDYLSTHYGPVPAKAQGRRAPLQNVKWYTL